LYVVVVVRRYMSFEGEARRIGSEGEVHHTAEMGKIAQVALHTDLDRIVAEMVEHPIAVEAVGIDYSEEERYIALDLVGGIVAGIAAVVVVDVDNRLHHIDSVGVEEHPIAGLGRHNLVLVLVRT
jgi:hypothetical protein